MRSKRATAEDEKTIEDMKRQPDGKDAFEGAVVGQTVKVSRPCLAVHNGFQFLTWLDMQNRRPTGNVIHNTRLHTHDTSTMTE